MIRSKLTYGNVTATVALFAALGGSAYAAATIDSADIVDGSVRSRDLRNGDVRGTDIRNGTLTARDFARGALPTGPQGPAGAEGPAGVQGPAGPQGDPGLADVVVITTSGELSSAGTKLQEAVCTNGRRAIAGGGIVEQGTDTAPAVGVALTESRALGADRWRVEARETTADPGTWRLIAQVVCARVAG